MPKKRIKKPFKGDGFSAVHWSFWDSGHVSLLGPTAWTVLSALHRYADKNGYAFPGVKTLARVTGLSMPTISRAKKKLVDLEYIIITRSRLRGHEFRMKPLRNEKVKLSVAKDADTSWKLLLGDVAEFKSKYRSEAAECERNITTLRKIVAAPPLATLAEKHKSNLDPVYLFYALHTHDYMTRLCKENNRIFNNRLHGKTPALVSLINRVIPKARQAKQEYLVALDSFFVYLQVEKASKDLNYGLLPGLALDWLRHLELKPA